jgi:hypothetical protein
MRIEIYNENADPLDSQALDVPLDLDSPGAQTRSRSAS